MFDIKIKKYAGLFLQYLNTVIPYEKKGSALSVEELQMLTKSKWKLLTFTDTVSHVLNTVS